MKLPSLRASTAKKASLPVSGPHSARTSSPSLKATSPLSSSNTSRTRPVF